MIGLAQAARNEALAHEERRQRWRRVASIGRGHKAQRHKADRVAVKTHTETHKERSKRTESTEESENETSFSERGGDL